jgi:hypothetical protein
LKTFIDYLELVFSLVLVGCMSVTRFMVGLLFLVVCLYIIWSAVFFLSSAALVSAARLASAFC